MGPYLQKKYNYHCFGKKGTGDSEESYSPSSTGESDENGVIIKTITLDNYLVTVLLTLDNRFIDILEIKNKKPNLSPHPLEDQVVDVNDEYPE